MRALVALSALVMCVSALHTLPFHARGGLAWQRLNQGAAGVPPTLPVNHFKQPLDHKKPDGEVGGQCMVWCHLTHSSCPLFHSHIRTACPPLALPHARTHTHTHTHILAYVNPIRTNICIYTYQILSQTHSVLPTFLCWCVLSHTPHRRSANATT